MSDCYEVSGDEVEDTWGVGAKSGGLRPLFNEASFKELEGYVCDEGTVNIYALHKGKGKLPDEANAQTTATNSQANVDDNNAEATAGNEAKVLLKEWLSDELTSSGHSYDDDDSTEDESYKMNPKEMEDAYMEDEWDIKKGQREKEMRAYRADSIGNRRAVAASKWSQSESATIGGVTETTFERGYNSHQRDSKNEDLCYEDDDEEDTATEIHKRRKIEVYPTFNEKTDMFKVEVVVGQRWEITSAPDLDDSTWWQIKSMQQLHERCTRTFKNRLIIEHWLVNEFLDKILRNPLMKAIEMKEDMKVRYNIVVGLRKCQRAKGKALNVVQSLMEKQYGILKPYLTELVKSNPGTTYVLKTVEGEIGQPRQFKRFYVCFESLKTSMKVYCRPIIGVDGCFLKHACSGQLCAVGRDGNNHMFPCAWAVIERECTSGWDWFLKLVSEDLNMEEGDGWTVVSDQQKSTGNVLDTFMVTEERSTREENLKTILEMCQGHKLWKGPGKKKAARRKYRDEPSKGKRAARIVGRPLPDLVQAEVPPPSTYQQQSRKGQGTAATTTSRGAASSSTGWLETARGRGRGKRGRGRSRGRGTPVGIGLICGEGGTISFSESGNEPPVVISHSQMSSKPT
ncbi:50S ribosomal protein L4 [Bienertia sinuspersici]